MNELHWTATTIELGFFQVAFQKVGIHFKAVRRVVPYYACAKLAEIGFHQDRNVICLCLYKENINRTGA